jgi:hypothetical protein
MALADRFAPDPTESYMERRLSLTDADRRERARRMRAQDKTFAQAFMSRVHPAPEPAAAAPPSCPHLANLEGR